MTSVGESLLVIQTGGTIDKCYPRRPGAYAFEIGDPASTRIMNGIKPSYIVDFETVCKKDSQDLNDGDRNRMLLSIRKTLHRKILIVHGTDTLTRTAAFLGPRIQNKLVVLTGSKLPETFKGSDADFNIGLAIGALQMSDKRGVYVAMNGEIHRWDKISRHNASELFVSKL